MTSSCFRSTPDGSPIPCGPPTTTLEQVRDWNNRERKLFVISIGQSNNGTENELPGVPPDAVLDAPDPNIYELSQGLFQGPERPWVANIGERHVFQDPAQDDRGGITMRLSGAKYLRTLFPTVSEITVFCGAIGGSSLRRQWDPYATNGVNIGFQRTVAFCDTFMRDNPDHDVIFWCSLGYTDGAERMGLTDPTLTELRAAFEESLANLVSELRSQIHGAERAIWVQGDIPDAALELFSNETKKAEMQTIALAQRTISRYVPISTSATMSDLSIYDIVHLDRPSLRTFGQRMAAASSF